MLRASKLQASSIAFCLLSLLVGCSEPGHGTGFTPIVSFACENGRNFTIEYRGNRARVTTSTGSYVLDHRRSSFGTKYLSEEAAFIQDEDRGFLEGAGGGPFRECHEAA